MRWGKILLVPLMTTAAFIFFAARYLTDTNKGFAVLIPSTGTFALQTFPMDVIQFVTSCHNMTPLVVIDPDSIRCFYGINGDSCDQKTSFPIYRFALLATEENLTNARSDFRQIVSCGFGCGWKSSLNASLNSIVLWKNDMIVTISILEVRPKYWYLHASRSTLLHEPPRAFRGLNLSQIKVDSQNETMLLVPEPLDFYLWQYTRSRFLECNRTSAKYLRKKNPWLYHVPPVINDTYVQTLAYARNLFSDHHITIMLAGGTALGWYRECGIIPHTTDTDMAFLISEWKPEMENHLLKDTTLTLHWILLREGGSVESLIMAITKGRLEQFKHLSQQQAYRPVTRNLCPPFGPKTSQLVADGIEFTVGVGGNKIDIFGLYERDNSSFVGGIDSVARQKLRWWYPKFNGTCTCDLKGELFYVRCDILAVLIHEYEPKWYEHHHSKHYSWSSSHHNVQKAGKIKISDMPSVVRKFG